MGKVTGFMEYTRELPQRRDPAQRIKDWFEIYQPFPEDHLRTQAARCMDCGVPFCHTGCPLTNIIPDWNDLVYKGRWKEAVRQLHATNNFPEFTGRICPAPCEAACVLGINEPAVTIKQIEKTIIDRAFEQGYIVPEPPAVRSGKRVAVIGSRTRGTGRRAATGARRARRHGVRKERPHRRTAALRHSEFQDGEAPDRPAAGADARRRGQVRDECARGRECAGGRPAAASSTPSCWRAARSSRANLNVPGRELKGIHFAMEFLPQQNRVCEGDTVRGPDSGHRQARDHHRRRRYGRRLPGHQPPAGRALGHAVRTAAQAAGRRARRSTPWPLWPMQLRIESSHEEGGTRDWSVNTVKFTGDENGNVKQLHAVRVGRRRSSKPLPGTEFTLEADLVLLAMGFTGPVKNGMIEQLGVALDGRGNVAADANYMSSVPGVFAAGDMRRGQSLVVWAIAEGRKAAEGVDRYLKG